MRLMHVVPIARNANTSAAIIGPESAGTGGLSNSSKSCASPNVEYMKMMLLRSVAPIALKRPVLELYGKGAGPSNGGQAKPEI